MPPTPSGGAPFKNPSLFLKNLETCGEFTMDERSFEKFTQFTPRRQK
jgi:hypothetical protein